MSIQIEPIPLKPVNPDQGVVLRPTTDHIIVIPLPDPETTKSGLYIPESNTKALRKARVVGIGPGMTNGKGHLIPMGIEMYDIVLIGGWVGTEVKVDGQIILIIRLDDVAAIVDEDVEVEAVRP